MSILVKGMEMPRACYDCPFFESIYHLHGCHAMPKSFDDMDMWNFVGDGRPSWCPLVSAPEPHGRLIDADELRQDWLENGENEYVYDTNAFLDSLDNAPTIIEAEGRE